MLRLLKMKTFHLSFPINIIPRSLIASLSALTVACALSACGGVSTTLTQANLDKILPKMTAQA